MSSIKSFGLGRGLSAIIPSKLIQPNKTETEKLASAGKSLIKEIPTVDILPNPNQPRKSLETESLSNLAESVKEYGLLQPIIVRELESNKYELIAGQRRLAAAKLAGLISVPAIIKRTKEADSLAISLIENLQRQDLNPIDEAEAYQELLTRFFFTKNDVARLAGKQPALITAYIDLLELTSEVKELVKTGQLNLTHAKVLLRISEASRQKALAKRIIRDELSAKKAEEILDDSEESQKSEVIKILNSGRVIRIKPPEKDPKLVQAQEELESILGTKVIVERKKHIGQIMIEFYSDEDLENLLTKFAKSFF